MVLGVDVGTAIVGWGMVSYSPQDKYGLKLVDYGTIRTDSDVEMPKRLVEIHAGLRQLIKNYGPAVAAVESLFFFKNQKTVMTVSQGRGVILLACEQEGLPIFEYTPLQVKSAVSGFGRAEKKQVQMMVKQLLGREEMPQPDDAADGLAIAICHIFNSNSRLPKVS